MFDARDEITEAVERLYGTCSGLQRGDIIPHAVIIEALGVQPYTDYWITCIKKLKRKFQDERGITIWPVRGIGYRLLTAKETLTEVVSFRLRKARREYDRTRRDVGCLPRKELTVHQCQLQQAAIQLARRAREDAEETARSYQSLCRKSETPPKRYPAPAPVS